MSLKLKRELLVALKADYAKAGYKQKTVLLDSFVTATGYNRKYAIKLLKRADEAGSIRKRSKQFKYGDDVKEHLVRIWRAAGYICSKRFIPFLPQFLPVLERCNYLTVPESIRDLLLQISPATADRLLCHERKQLGRSRSTTRAGNRLRKEIAVRTCFDWDDLRPGFFEVDLVAHNGGVTTGQCVHTFTLTDVSSGWVEMQALINKGEDQVLSALPRIRRLLPIEMVGFDSDNGGEFMNHLIHDYCETENIKLTRGREGEKNDQNYVEEKNGSVVRRLVGYSRLEGQAACDLLAALYRAARLYVNYFQPSEKLASKTRVGGRLRKRYHPAKTPCHRLLESNIPEHQKARLQRMFATLDPIALLGRIELIQSELLELIRSGQQADSPRPQVDSSIDSSIPAAAKSSTELALIRQEKRKRKAKTTYKPKPPDQHRSLGRKNSVPIKLQKTIYALLAKDPSLNATKVLRELNGLYPGSFQNRNKQTLFRLIQKWREAHPEFLDLYHGNCKNRRKQSRDCM
jgi:hypothetical protein